MWTNHLLFRNPNDMLMSGHIVGDKLYKTKRVLTDGLRPSKNMVVVFPSSLYHSVTQFTGEQSRYSITYDIVLTGAKVIEPGSSESVVLHPSYWSPFGEQPSEDST